eukprot:g18469.t1
MAKRKSICDDLKARDVPLLKELLEESIKEKEQRMPREPSEPSEPLEPRESLADKFRQVKAKAKRHEGAQVAVDVTLVSPVARDGTAPARCAAEPGAAAADAAARMQAPRDLSRVAQAPRARLAVLALEIGGRRGDDCEHFLRVLAAGGPSVAATAALHHRWGSLRSLAAQGSLVTTLPELPEQGGGAPPSPAVLADLRQDERQLPCT